MRLIILSGMSGSGKSTAARVFEDQGFYVADNLPPVLLPRFVTLIEESVGPVAGIVVVVDVRSLEFFREFKPVLAELDIFGHTAEIVFFDADDSVLVRRYSETRRSHPLAKKEGVTVGIERERLLLAPLRSISSRIIDTSNLNTHQLRATIISLFCDTKQAQILPVRLQSFGFSYGVPPESDLVMDVRFLPNPHFDARLRPLTGLDKDIQDFVNNSSPAQDFFRYFGALLVFLLPQYQREGKSYLTVSVGCTGGRHRSVAVVEALRHLTQVEGIALEVFHRDVSRG
ncbi:MAG: RNase adapter RapZ [Desulfuromonadales bacterium]|nr:RNase adapter RapZ [Desulfuromonadales bacterium]MDT8423818.1 RNase adapter RapZ [Desulfuromonadales bacterium]